MLDRSGGSGSDEIRELWQRGINEYKSLLKLFIETKAKINRECGCSEEKEIELKKEFDRLTSLVNSKNSEITTLSGKIRGIIGEIDGLDGRRDNLWGEYEDKINEVTRSEISKTDISVIFLQHKA